MNKTRTENRFGKVVIPIDFLEKELLYEIFNKLKFTVTRAEALYHMDSIEYVGFSPFFEIMNQGEIYNSYEIRTQIDEETTKYYFVKIGLWIYAI